MGLPPIAKKPEMKRASTQQALQAWIPLEDGLGSKRKRPARFFSLFSVCSFPCAVLWFS